MFVLVRDHTHLNSRAARLLGPFKMKKILAI